MGGPGANVLVRNALTKQQEDELEIWLRSVTHHLEKDKWGYKFWWNDDVFPGTVSGCLFYLSLEDIRIYWDEDETRQIEELLGFLPEQSIGVSSGCNQDADHTTLGHAMLHLARAYGGLIDMGGAISPPLKPVSRERLEEWWTTLPAQERERWTYIQERIDALRPSFPPGKTLRDLMKERYTDPKSQLRAIMADVEAKFGPVLSF